MSKEPGDKQEELPEKFTFDKLRFKSIEVISSGILYRGILIGADESDIYMKGRLRWLILPIETITSLKLEGRKESFNPRKSVDAGFYLESDQNND
jgi:hypothetical protein